MARLAAALGCIVVLACGAILFKFGTLSPCEIVREQIRQEGLRQGQLASVVAVLAPDSALDALAAASYGPLTPGRCIGLLFNRKPVPQTTQQTPIRPAAPSQASNIHVLGIGAGSTCGTWAAIEKSGGIPEFQIRAWTQGYLSSAALRGSSGADPLADMDASGLFAWLDQYCLAQPAAKFSDALDAFLRERQRTSNPH